jgi:metal-responsive CopG/Arc/MetJ family transcriptional regulator
MATLAVDVPDKLLARIDEFVAQKHKTRSDVIVEALDRYCEYERERLELDEALDTAQRELEEDLERLER